MVVACGPGRLAAPADLSNWFPGFWVARDFPETWRPPNDTFFAIFADSLHSTPVLPILSCIKGRPLRIIPVHSVVPRGYRACYAMLAIDTLDQG